MISNFEWEIIISAVNILQSDTLLSILSSVSSNTYLSSIPREDVSRASRSVNSLPPLGKVISTPLAKRESDDENHKLPQIGKYHSHSDDEVRVSPMNAGSEISRESAVDRAQKYDKKIKKLPLYHYIKNYTADLKRTYLVATH